MACSRRPWTCGWIVVAVGCAGRVEADRTRTDETLGGSATAAAGGSTSVFNGGGPAASGSTSVFNGGGPAVGGSAEPLSFWATCGNGALDENEECDDGNRMHGDGCARQCAVEYGYACDVPGEPCRVLSVCGNGKLEFYESCDDGNLAAGDGCSPDCQSVESGWICRTPGQRCAPVCGNGVVQEGEGCDDGSSNGIYSSSGALGCSRGCTVVPSCELASSPSPCITRCGDGVVDGGEECDLGASNVGLAYGGCSVGCTYGPYCGDGVLSGEEECDLAATNAGWYGEGLCTPTCRKAAYCGNGLIEGAFGEMCDTSLPPVPPGMVCDSDCVLTFSVVY